VVDDIKKQQEEINRKIGDAYDRLEELTDEEVRINDELQQLNKERARYTILSEVSDQLEKLEKLGGSDLFWGDEVDRDSVVKHQRRVRDQVINYDSRVAELQERMRERDETVESLTAKINLLNDDSINLQAHEEALAEEFVIEREMVEEPFRPMHMPWNHDDHDQKRFRKILLAVFLFSVVLGILIPMWEIPIPDRVEVVEIPERLAKLMVPKKEPPPPPPKPKQEEKKPDQEKQRQDGQRDK
jgi:prefoldin subunit 5